MTALRIFGLAAALALASADVAEAGPMPVRPATDATAHTADVEAVRLVCGPYRCFGYRRFGGFGFRRYGWRRW